MGLAAELLLAIVLLAAGALALPIAVYYTGSRLFGPYEGGTGGMGSFLLGVYDSLAALEPGAWLLVLSPLVCVLLLRLAFRLFRRPRAVADAAGEHPDEV